MIRRAKEVDALGIHEAHMRSIREVCVKDYTPEQIEAWGGRKPSEIRRQEGIKNHFVWVVEEGGKIQGFGQLTPSGEILSLYLVPEVIGNGYGKEIIGLIKKQARELGLPRLYCNSTITSVGFYERQGFRRTGKRIGHDVNGVPIPCYPMEMNL